MTVALLLHVPVQLAGMLSETDGQPLDGGEFQTTEMQFCVLGFGVMIVPPLTVHVYGPHATDEQYVVVSPAQSIRLHPCSMIASPLPLITTIVSRKTDVHGHSGLPGSPFGLWPLPETVVTVSVMT